MQDIMMIIRFSCLNEALGKLYQDAVLREKIFGGEISLEQKRSGIKQVDWRWNTMPTVGAAADSPGEILLEEKEFRLDFGVSALCVPLNIVCAVNTRDAAFRLQVDRVELEVSGLSELDRVLVREEIEPPVQPYITDAANRILAGAALPPVCLAGVSFGSFGAAVDGEKIVISGGLNGAAEEAGQLSAPDTGEPVQFYLSKRAVVKIADGCLRKFIGYDKFTDGSTNLGIGNVSYHCGVRIEEIAVSQSGGPAWIEGTVRLRPYASATVKLLFVPLGISYRGDTSPKNLQVRIALGMEENSVVAAVNNVEGFTIVLTPDGSVDEKILSSVVWPLSELIVNLLTPMAGDMLRQIKMTAVTIKEKRFEIVGTSWSAAAENQKINNRVYTDSATGEELSYNANAFC